MPSELLVESFYAYIPESHGSSHPLAVRSQRLTYAIKDGRKARGRDGGWSSETESGQNPPPLGARDMVFLSRADID